MVSLTERSQYLQQFGSDLYARAFVDFLMDSKMSADETLSGETANDLGLMALRAIQDNDRPSFDGVYDRISGRRPKPDSDWLYNDLLLFALAVGIVQFRSDAGWLRHALQTRVESTEGESQLIAQTLLDAVNGNFDNTNNHGPLLIVVKHTVNIPLGPPHRINSIYRQLTEGPFPPHESSFLNAISIRAVDAIILAKELGDLESRLSTERFLDSFTVRIEQIAAALWSFLVVLAIAVALWFIYRYLRAPAPGRGTFETILSLLPLLGVPSVGVLLAKRQQIEAWLKGRLLRFFKYPV